MLSIRGRLTLIKAVLGSLGGSQDSKKLAWIKWSNALSSYEKGGLNIGSLKYFNLSLLKNGVGGCSPSRMLFRLYRLEQDKDCLIIDHIVNGQWKWYWSREDIRIRNTTYLRNMLLEISQVDLNTVDDHCIWTMAKDGILFVGESRQIIDSKLLPSLVPSTSWDKTLMRKLIFSFRDWLWIGYLIDGISRLEALIFL
nr:hypothetical protein [Tanacetum cinerariifolium]